MQNFLRVAYMMSFGPMGVRCLEGDTVVNHHTLDLTRVEDVSCWDTYKGLQTRRNWKNTWWVMIRHVKKKRLNFRRLHPLHWFAKRPHAQSLGNGKTQRARMEPSKWWLRWRYLVLTSVAKQAKTAFLHEPTWYMYLSTETKKEVVSWSRASLVAQLEALWCYFWLLSAKLRFHLFIFGRNAKKTVFNSTACGSIVSTCRSAPDFYHASVHGPLAEIPLDHRFFKSCLRSAW